MTLLLTNKVEPEGVALILPRDQSTRSLGTLGTSNNVLLLIVGN